MFKPEHIRNSYLLDIKNKFHIFFINSSTEILIKKNIPTLSVIVFILIIFLPARAEEVNDISNQYKSVVIAEGKWGKELNEFIGIPNRLPVGTTETEESFDIDDKGNVYILHRAKIYKFNNGKWIKTIKGEIPAYGNDILADNNGNVFVLFGPWQQPENPIMPEVWEFSGIRIYDEELKLKSTYKLGKEVKNKGFNLDKDDLENIWYEDNDYRYPFYIDGQIYDSSKQINLAEKKEITIEENDFKILARKNKRIQFKTNFKKPMDRKRFLITDKENNTYFYFANRDLSEFEINKYDSNGNISGKMELSKPIPKYKEASTLIHTPIKIDKSGNIYQLNYTEEGLKVIKWEKIN